MIDNNCVKLVLKNQSRLINTTSISKTLHTRTNRIKKINFNERHLPNIPKSELTESNYYSGICNLYNFMVFQKDYTWCI